MENNIETGISKISAPKELVAGKLITQPQIDFANKLNSILVEAAHIKDIQNPIVKELIFANAKFEIETLLTDEIMKNIYKLFGDPGGVKMDKEYPDTVKKRIFIQAVMQGLSCIGNQINVIGGNMYIRAQGYLPKLRNYPNFSFVYPFRHRIPVKDPTSLTTTVTTDMEWTLNGKTYKESVTYPVARQDGQGNDAILGKANTKMCSWLWNKISGEDTVDDSGVYTDAEVLSSQAKSNSEQSSSSQENPASTSTTSKDSNEIKETQISKEFQDKFNEYISKELNGKLVAKSKIELTQRAKQWLDSTIAKTNGATYRIEGDIIKSGSVDLTVYNSILEKLP